jgi:hypothetical protein
MNMITTDSYRGWNIRVYAEHTLCSNFSFDVTDPSGKTRQVRMGGGDRDQALERARELIEMELSMLEEA